MKKKMIMALLALTILTNAGVATLYVQSNNEILVGENADVPRLV
ncbi:hypothetical protein [Fusibacter sp. 3D3]|nr:hypothetical protein [Fusibacter sp. 3D3]GAU76820.1 hypothetical protein F3D3_1418 [Fusibacter sp. 3D3]